jgi:peptidoglycan-N-acetylglucosamine deacetylase
MMRNLVAVLCWLGLLGALTAAAECPGNPNALGTSRVLSIDPAEHTRLGTMQYAESLPLADREVVITFDDGPIPPYSTRVLDALAKECVKATYFLVGRMARTFPDSVRRIHAEGHTIGTHSQTHPFSFNQMPFSRMQFEIEEGISSVAAALGDRKAVAPFFRIPGLARGTTVEAYLHNSGIMTWSADIPADDWMRIQASEIVDRALRRLESKGRGILLLHDIQPATALAMPRLLSELKLRGFQIVHVVPAGAERPKTPTSPQDWMVSRGRQPWPRVVSNAKSVTPLPPPPALPASELFSFADDVATTQSIGYRRQPLALKIH